MAGGIEKALKKLNDDWQGAEIREMQEGFFVPADGQYIAILKSAGLGLSKENERPQIVWDLVMAEGNDEGKAWKKFDGLETAMNMSFAKGIMKAIGITIPKNIEKLPAALEEFFDENKKGVRINVSVKSAGGFTNTYINGLADKESKSADEPVLPDVDSMKMKELKALIKEKGLDIDTDDFEGADEVRAAVKKALGKSKKKSRFSDD